MPNSTSQSHPSAETLRRFGNGEIHGPESDDIAQHLETCDDCCRHLRDLTSSPLLERLQAAAAADSGNPRAVGTPTSAGLRFRILRPHAKGGLGQVYVAHDAELQREVALKEIQDRHADNKENRARFLLEAEITGGLEHPGIVPVYGLGQYADGRPFYAMRFIRGDSLHSAIKEFHQADVAGRERGKRTLELRKLLGRFIDVCQAIQYAHDRGVVHRDLKPGNIMLGKYGETLVVDWGLAKAVGKNDCASKEPTLNPASACESPETLPGHAVGTPAFMSPEQAGGRPDLVGPASDVYSLGATLYSLLTGKAAVEDKDVAVLIEKVRAGKLTAPRQHKPDVDRALEAICLKAMALEPANRYGSPRALADDLEHWLADEPVSAHREPLKVRAGRWVRKHRTLVTSAAAVLVVVTVGSMVASALLANLNGQLEARNEELGAANRSLKTTNEQLEQARLVAENAADAAKRAQNSSDKRLVHVEKINDALQSIFKDIDPTAAEKGGPLLVEQLANRLEEIADTLDLDLIGDANTLGRMRSFLGRTLGRLGNSKKAIELLTKARAEAENSRGPDHRDTAVIMTNLASAYQADGQLAKALPLFEEALAKVKVKLGPDHPGTLTSLALLARAYHAAGQTAKALPMQEEAVAKLKATLGPDHPDTLTIVGSLAQMYHAAGQFTKALPLLEENLAQIKAKLGPDHPHTQAIMNNLAKAYHDVGQTAKALPLFEEALAKLKAKLGPDHPDTQAIMNNLARAYRDAGQTAKALPLIEEALAKLKVRLGPDHPYTLTGMSDLARAYQDAGQLAKALPLLEETLAKTKVTLGPDHSHTLTGMNNLASAYQADGQLAKALPLYEETLAKRKATLGPDHPHTLISMNNLAGGYQADGQLAKALPLYEETLAKRKVKIGADHPHTLSSMNNLARAYQADGQLAKALPLFEEALAKTKVKIGADHPDTLISMNNLAKAYQADGQLAKALPLLEETLARSKANPGPDHPYTLIFMNNLAQIHLAAKNPSKAVPLFDAFVKAKRKQFGAADPRFADSLSKVAVDLLKHEQYAAAEPMLHECLEIRVKSQPDSWSTFNTKTMLGAALLGQKKYADAEPLLLAGYDGMKERAAKIPPAGKIRLTEAAGRLAELFEATRTKDETKLPGKLTDASKETIHEVKLTAGKPAVIEMQSKQFNTYLRLEDAKGKTLAENDHVDPTNKNLNSRILFIPKKDGVFRVVATSFEQTGRGEYEIILRQYSPGKSK